MPIWRVSGAKETNGHWAHGLERLVVGLQGFALCAASDDLVLVGHSVTDVHPPRSALSAQQSPTMMAMVLAIGERELDVAVLAEITVIIGDITGCRAQEVDLELEPQIGGVGLLVHGLDLPLPL